jgi:hypothetical protein
MKQSAQKSCLLTSESTGVASCGKQIFSSRMQFPRMCGHVVWLNIINTSEERLPSFSEQKNRRSDFQHNDSVLQDYTVSRQKREHW